MASPSDNPPLRPDAPLHAREALSPRERSPWVHALYALICVYLFLSAINVMGAGLKTFGDESDLLTRALEFGTNPFIALLGALLITAIVQSSSFTTALIVTLVATGDLTMGSAVYAIMGANIGTSLTALVVALANIRIRRNFRRSFTAALLHDLFNLLSVAVMFPLEWITSALHPERLGILARLAGWFTERIGLQDVVNPSSPLRVLTSPLVALSERLGTALMPTPASQGLFVAAAGAILLFVALIWLVQNLRGALLRHMDSLFRGSFFRTDVRAYGVGTIATLLIQSSTVAISLIVPLAGAGTVPMRRLFPYILGCNLGTTFTTVLAAMSQSTAAALTIALVHVLFNVAGTVLWYPLRHIPYGLASWYARLASRSLRYAFLFLLLIFLILPIGGIALTELLIS